MHVFPHVAVVLALTLAQTECQSSCNGSGMFPPEFGMDYRTPSNIASFWNIATWQECAALCAKITAPEQCEYWSWLDFTSPVYAGYCWLKESNGEYVSSNHGISGSKDCNYMNYGRYGIIDSA